MVNQLVHICLKDNVLPAFLDLIACAYPGLKPWIGKRHDDTTSGRSRNTSPLFLETRVNLRGSRFGLIPILGESSPPDALSRGEYPWYDATKDAPRSVLGPDWSWLDDWFKFNQQPRRPMAGWNLNWSDPAELIFQGLIMLGLAILMVVLVEFWRRYRPSAAEKSMQDHRHSGLGRIEGLPADIQPKSSDPWVEAQRLRDRGDHIGAIIALFAHQLLTLDRIQQIRLVPGRTGRQFVRSVTDLELKRPASLTLRLFEAAIYGHQSPRASGIEKLWAEAAAFERHVATSEGSR